MNSNQRNIIAAVREEKEFEIALRSAVTTIFFLNADIKQLSNLADTAFQYKKSLYIHIDLVTGLGKDKSGIEYAKDLGIYGILSTRANLIKIARECGLKTVQRCFIVDSGSIDTALESVKSSKPDMLEVMPGIAPKIIKKLKRKTQIPIISGGLIETCEEANQAIESGAYAVSTGCSQLWSF